MTTDSSSFDDFLGFTNDQLIRSIEYLFLSAQFETVSTNRPGIAKIIRDLSDDAWHKGVAMITESSRRGVKHSMQRTFGDVVEVHGRLNEVEALAKILDTEKKTLMKANAIHRHHSHATLTEGKAKAYDVGMALFLQDEVIKGKINTVRKLTGHVNDLKKIIKRDGLSRFSMALYLFDQYLQY